MSWDSIKESDDSEFLKIKAGTNVRIHVIGNEPEYRVEHFINNKPQKCDGKGCELCADGHEKRESWSILVFNMDAKRSQTLNQGKAVYRKIKNIRREYNNSLDAVDLKISREGATKTDTKYEVVPVPTLFKPEMLTQTGEAVPF